MEDGLLSLKWNNHKITFFEILRTLREKSNYTDATIAVEGKFYPVHKLVMSTCSEYFQDIFARTPCKSPVIVLKDVRSQDMDALLDYMYLGEVNVNQNDLASLLKTAECLRIKGLAVPDEDPTKARKDPADERQDSPPPKRRRHDDSSRPVSPPPSAPNKTPTPLSSPIQPSSQVCSQSSPDHLDSDPPPHIVKVEMQEHDHEDGYRQDSYEGSVNEEGGGGDYGPDVSKTEHDPESYGSSSFPGPSLQPGGDLAWEEGDSSSFPPESFSGDVAAGQQPQGELSGMMMCGQLMQMLEEEDNDTGRCCSEEELSAEISAGDPSTAATQLHSGNAADSGMSGGGGLYLHHQQQHLLQQQQQQMTLPVNNLGMSFPILSQTTNNDTATTATTCSSSSSTSSSFGIRPGVRFYCPVCPKGFRSKLDVERHLRTHTGEKPFTCPYCPHRSATKGNLKAHIRHIHVTTPQPVS